jgi:RHS repeat-associated protein
LNIAQSPIVCLSPAGGEGEEAEAGLYYYNARWYDPEVGRFIQADSIIPEPGNPLAWDRYSYANNNPLNYTDPSGHSSDSYCEQTGSYRPQCLANVNKYNQTTPKARTISTVTPPITNTASENIGIMCGSDGESLNNIGPSCTSSGSMSVWTQQNAYPGYTILSPQIYYPGIDKEEYEGKTGQAQMAIDSWGDLQPDILIGYSAGADWCNSKKSPW